MESLLLVIVLLHLLLSYLAFRSFLKWMVVLRQRIDMVGKSVVKAVEEDGSRTRHSLKQ